MTINKLQLNNLVNSDHINLMEFTAKATEKYPYIAEVFPTPVQFIKNAYQRENDAYLKRNRSFITKQVQEANETRIKRFREVNNTLKAAELCTDPGKAEAAVFLLEIIKDYGGASKILASRVDSMSGILTNLVEDFQLRFADKVAATGLTECVEELRVANETYKRLRSDRTQEVSEQEKEEMVKARAASDTAWRGLIDLSNWRYYYKKDALLVPFMKYMNTEVEWYRTILGQKQASSSDKEEDGETTPPTTEPSEPENPGTNEPSEPENPGTTEPSDPGTGTNPPTGGEEQEWPVINPDDQTVYTGKLNNYDGTSTMTYTVSGKIYTPIDIPAPFEGYMWPTNMPSVMPPCDFQANTLPVDSDVTTLYKLEYMDGDTLLRTDYLHAGDIVFLYAAPDGKEWDHIPARQKMPASNWVLRTKDAV